MPHKRNPALCMLALEAGQRAPGLAATLLAGLSPEHERGLGQWQGQWLVMRQLFLAASSAVGAMAEVLAGLEVDTAAMQANLERLSPKKPSDDTAARAMIEQALARWREKAP
jgi:3-carboxy-cis,cis-muconate cycloisomerase